MGNEINITSIKDERIVEARSLQTSAGRLGQKKILLEGVEQISWSLESPCHLQHVFVHDKQKDHPFIKTLTSKKIPFYFVSDGILKKLLIRPTLHHLLEWPTFQIKYLIT